MIFIVIIFQYIIAYCDSFKIHVNIFINNKFWGCCRSIINILKINKNIKKEKKILVLIENFWAKLKLTFHFWNRHIEAHFLTGKPEGDIFALIFAITINLHTYKRTSMWKLIYIYFIVAIRFLQIQHIFNMKDIKAWRKFDGLSIALKRRKISAFSISMQGAHCTATSCSNER